MTPEGEGVDPGQAREVSERDQLWASLRALRPAVDRLAAGGFDGSAVDEQIVTLVARIVAAELDFRAREAAAG